MMTDDRADEGSSPDEKPDDALSDKTKVQDLAKAGRDDFDPNEGQE